MKRIPSLFLPTLKNPSNISLSVRNSYHQVIVLSGRKIVELNPRVVNYSILHHQENSSPSHHHQIKTNTTGTDSNCTAKRMDSQVAHSLNRLVCFVEGNIGSGKSTTAKELQLFNENSVSEQQKTEEWTLLSKYYEGGIHKKDLTLNYELQKQIANTYFKHYFKYNFVPSGAISIGDLFDDKSLEIMMKKHEKCLRIHPNTKLPETSSLPSTSSQHNQPSPSNVYNIFFEGILSSSGVFTVMEYNKGMIKEDDYADLCQNYDALKKGVTGHMAFYLKPTNNIDVCLERIKARRREFESVIEKPYLKTIEEHYDSFMDKVASRIPVFVIDNSTMDAKETAALIVDVISAVRKDIKYM